MPYSKDPMPEFRSTKTFYNFPCAHRQWKHRGNCALLHGYSRSFVFTFAAHNPDNCGFIVDYGDLDWLKAHLEYMYDHTLLLCVDDPLLPQFQEIEKAGGCQLRHHIVQGMGIGVGMEDTALYLTYYADFELRKRTKGRCWIVSVEARENDKNSSIYYNPDAGFRGWQN